MQLNFRTRGKDISPQGKPRVFFCCHPEDFDIYFESVSQEILNLENCAIFYDEQPNGGGDTAEWQSRLADMQLFVMPVTSRLLSGNNKGLDDYQIAIKNHIPVLPLMQEDGLDQLFNSVCCNLQYLNKHQKDETAISYQEKLKTFLDGVLVGDETAKAIREAFRSYIFLSYRKKDRVHAQRLMRLIHKCDLCQDVAIWSDEYLVPGEDFNNAIGDALNKSQLFLLSVTPNLVCESNYVQAVEYPMALKSGKGILPVEMCATDRGMLASQYANLPTVISESDEVKLVGELAKFFPRDDDPKDDVPRYHLLALAYLDGIDVEVDHQRALEMLKYCASRGYFSSFETIVDMYKHGKGVERDINQAIKWQERYVYVIKDILPQGLRDTKIDYYSQLTNLGDMYKSLLDYDKSIQVYTTLKEFCEWWLGCAEQRDFAFVKSMLSYACNFLGEVYWSKYEFDKAQECYHLSLKTSEELAEIDPSIDTCYNLSTCYRNLGRCYESQGKYEQALTYHNDRLRVLNTIAELDPDNRAYCDDSLMCCYTDLYDIYEQTCDIPNARECITQALAIAERLDQEQNTDYTKDSLHVVYTRMAGLANVEEDLLEERNWYLKALDIAIHLADKQADIVDRQRLARTLFNLSANSRALGNYDEAEDYILKALYLREELVKFAPIPETQHTLVSTYLSVAKLYDNLSDTEKAVEMLRSAEKLLQQLISSNPITQFYELLSNCYYNLGRILIGSNENKDSEELYRKGLDILLKLYDDIPNDNYLRDAAPFYYGLSSFYVEKDPDQSLEYALKAFELDLNYAKAHESPENWRQCIIDLSYLGNFYHLVEENDELAIECYENALTISKDLISRVNSPYIFDVHITLLEDLSDIYVDMEEYDKAIFYCQSRLDAIKQVMQISKSPTHARSFYSTNYQLSQIYIKTIQVVKAKQCMLDGINMLEANLTELRKIKLYPDEILSNSYLTVADICHFADDDNLALQYYDKALACAMSAVENDSADQEVLTDVWRRLALFYKENRDYSKQLEYLLMVVADTLAIAQKDDNCTNLVACGSDCKDVADCYANLDDYENAVDYYNIARGLLTQGREICLKIQDDDQMEDHAQLYATSTKLLAEVEHSLGAYYHQIGDVEQSVEHLAPAIEIALDFATITNDAEDWMALAKYCLTLGQFAGIQPLEKAEEVLQTLLDDNPMDETCIQMLSEVRKAKKMYQ